MDIKKTFKTIISFVTIILFFTIILQTSFAQENDSTQISTEIEIVPSEEKIQEPGPSSASVFNPESYNEHPFVPPYEESNEGNFSSLPSSSVTLSEKDEDKDIFTSPVPEEAKIIENKPEDKSEEHIEEIMPVSPGSDLNEVFKYTGVLWNGFEYIGTVTSGKESFIVRAGDELKEGYRVIYLNEKEMMIIKEEKKGKLILN